MTSQLTPAERLKFGLLAEGVAIDPAAQAYIDAGNGGRAMTPADYASTSGIILALADDVWVNAPVAAHNPNFVSDPEFVLTVGDEGLRVEGRGLASEARFWLPPAYHGEVGGDGAAFNSYAFTHGDRVRASPVEGCAMTCKFCDLPYEFRYRTKSIDGLVAAVQRALDDEIQPAKHVLLSGGTPRPADYGYLRDCYRAVIEAFPEIDVDIMMVPIDEVMDARWLDDLGVAELSINLEIFDRDLARSIMRRKADQGRDHYLDSLESAARVLGPGRVRSMLMVGIEPLESTLEGVAAIAARGCVPVLSPFRPDQATPLRAMAPPSAEVLEATYLQARAIAADHGVPLGATCIPCSHNTLTLAEAGSGDASYFHGVPHTI